MSRQEKTREVIKQLKKVREDRGLSLQRIVDMLEEKGTPVSMTTVRRVFEAGSEDRNFRYEDSIKPVADLLLEIHGDAAPSGPDAAELEALRALVRYKNSYIAELERDAAKTENKIQAVKDESQRKIEFLREQINVKDDERKANVKLLDERRDFIYRLEDEKKQLRRTNGILSLLLAVCVILIIAALVVDVMNPDKGFFWLDGISHVFNGGLFQSSAETYFGTHL